MKTAFDVPPGSANFDRIAPRRPEDYLAISDVFHKTFLNLDEKGIEAAAATAILLRAAGIQKRPKPVEVLVDHPFLFTIVAQSRPESSGHLFVPRPCYGSAVGTRPGVPRFLWQFYLTTMR